MSLDLTRDSNPVRRERGEPDDRGDPDERFEPGDSVESDITSGDTGSSNSRSGSAQTGKLLWRDTSLAPRFLERCHADEQQDSKSNPNQQGLYE